MTRAAQALIDLGALRHNLQRLREQAPQSKVLAVIKANGYGHDVVRVAKALHDADGFGVACLEEALLLRKAGIAQPILLLQGFNEAVELPEISVHDLHSVVHHPSQLDMLAQAHLPRPINIWLKVDTGMHRLGFPPEDAAAAWQRLRDCPAVAKPARLMSHFATADDREDRRAAQQLQRFVAATEGFGSERSIANSGGVLGWPASHLEWIRPGIALYGISPFYDTVGADHGLRPVMTLTSQLIAVNRVEKGEAVGYGGQWVAPRAMRVGVAGVGYGDGYPRHAPPGTPVLVNGRPAPLVGRVSMDMICVDLSDQSAAKPGDPVVVWGDRLPVEEVARYAGTIPYELVCKVTRRVRQIVIDGDA